MSNANQISIDDMISASGSFSNHAAKANAMDAPPEPVVDPTAKWGRQLEAVYEAIRHGGWMTLGEVAHFADCPEASGAARIRELDRKKGMPHQKRREGNGLVQYRLASQYVSSR